MSQQNAQILFMEMDSQTDQWADELLKYTRPSPALLTALPVRRLQANLKASRCTFTVYGGFSGYKGTKTKQTDTPPSGVSKLKPDVLKQLYNVLLFLIPPYIFH